MMISPEWYLEMHKEDSFEALIKERNSLVRELKSLEKTLFGNAESESLWVMSPGPEVEYQMTLLYLAKLCELMKERYMQDGSPDDLYEES